MSQACLQMSWTPLVAVACTCQLCAQHAPTCWRTPLRRLPWRWTTRCGAMMLLAREPGLGCRHGSLFILPACRERRYPWLTGGQSWPVMESPRARAWHMCASLSARRGQATDAERVGLSPGRDSWWPGLVRCRPAACSVTALRRGAPHPACDPHKIRVIALILSTNSRTSRSTLYLQWTSSEVRPRDVSPGF